MNSVIDEDTDFSRDDDAPCPECGCPFITEHVFLRGEGRAMAWRDQYGEWFCGPAYEVVTVHCMAVGCDWEGLYRYRYGKQVTDDSGFLSIGDGEFHGFQA